MKSSAAPAVAVVGAGPYGLSAAAHLRARGIETAVFGVPFSFWREMPPRMALKSPWSASSLSDPGRKYTLDRYIAEHGLPREEPVPVALFLSYGEWFRQKAVGEVDRTSVECIRPAGRGFALQLADGREVTASRVVMATGIKDYAYLPPFAAGQPGDLVSHTGDNHDFEKFRGMKVAVVGAGQSALEAAVFLYEAGAEVEVITRGPIRWANRRLYEMGGLVRTVFYPPADVGPVGLNWLVAMPGLFRWFPTRSRTALGRRAIRPSGAKWLRSRFAPEIKTSTYTGIVALSSSSDSVAVQTSDGSTRTFDRVVLGTGYRPDVRRIPILDPELVSRLRHGQGHPVLDGSFQSSVPRLHFIGALAGYSFGPLCRFVAGASLAAGAVARAA